MRAWRNPDEVPPGTSTREQLELIQALVRGELPASEFVDRWWPLNRTAAEAGERPVHGLQSMLRLVTAAAEDLEGEALIRAVARALTARETLEPGDEVEVRVTSRFPQGVKVLTEAGHHGIVHATDLTPGERLTVVVAEARRSRFRAVRPR
ncbi:hypothetical protein ACFVH6_22885 [Spirillospora sp. NPDC127200]